MLDDVRELMSEELLIALEVVTGEHDVRSPCIRARAERIGGGRSALVAVNAHATEVVTEARLEVRSRLDIEWQAGRVLTFHRSELFTHFESLDSLREWAGFYIAYERSYQEGCSLGSLASEIIKTDLDVRTELADAFDQWRDIFRDGLERMQRLGRISAEADPTRLASLLLSAYQGGMLLAQVARDIAPLKDALQAAIDYVQTFAMPPAVGVLEDR